MRVRKSNRSPLSRTVGYGDLVGKKVEFIPSYILGWKNDAFGEKASELTQKERQKLMVCGVVKWVHPRGRFMLVEYTGKTGSRLRECLPLPQCLHLVRG